MKKKSFIENKRLRNMEKYIEARKLLASLEAERSIIIINKGIDVKNDTDICCVAARKMIEDMVYLESAIKDIFNNGDFEYEHMIKELEKSEGA